MERDGGRVDRGLVERLEHRGAEVREQRGEEAALAAGLHVG
ncbi:MAG: hypothetical protein M5U08_13890 [Burkholderiales bacterium]|nr:hypothetical protein [Burkholderiales bacterium]